MIFVEGFRLLFVLAGSAAGFEIGRHADSNPHAPIVGLLLGAAITYVLGGVAGRLADRGLQHAVFLFRNTPPGEIFAASIISTTGMLLGLVVGPPHPPLGPFGLHPPDDGGGLVGPGHPGLAAGIGQGPPDHRRRRTVPHPGPASRRPRRATPSWWTARPSWTAT